MTRFGVSEILETLGLKDNGSSGHRTRAVFHYEPLLKLYKFEIPSLFGRLLRDEGTVLDRTDLALFQLELSKLFEEYGPLVWPLPGQGPRDLLLKRDENSRYSSDLVYPRDKSVLVGHLWNWIFSKHARPDIDVNALIEKSNKDARLKVFSQAEPGRYEARKRKATKAVQKEKITDRFRAN
ncbi:hypothetical protein SVAN01_08851 [Stagonosporopsis vannaccii]|nr:hypothetical protein SVAN01_08851 [Stagonosporopsis vannaccii]